MIIPHIILLLLVYIRSLNKSSERFWNYKQVKSSFHVLRKGRFHTYVIEL